MLVICLRASMPSASSFVVPVTTIPSGLLTSALPGNPVCLQILSEPRSIIRQQIVIPYRIEQLAILQRVYAIGNRCSPSRVVRVLCGACSQIDVGIVDNRDPGILVSFEMTCHLKNAGLVRFGTYFEPPGRLRVERRIDPS